MAQGPFSLTTAVNVLERLVHALDYAHSRGVIHRDLKPQNILLDQWQKTYLSDFGIAKLIAQESTLTEMGVVIGTSAYMSPEQVQGEEIDYRSQEIVLDGTFEEPGNWALPTTALSAEISTELAHEGDQSLRLGDTSAGDRFSSYSSAYRVISIPAEVTNATLSFWYYPLSMDEVSADSRGMVLCIAVLLSSASSFCTWGSAVSGLCCSTRCSASICISGLELAVRARMCPGKVGCSADSSKSNPSRHRVGRRRRNHSRIAHFL